MSQEEKMSRRPFTALRIASHVGVPAGGGGLLPGAGGGAVAESALGHAAVAGRRGDWRPEREVDAKSPPLAPVGARSTARSHFSPAASSIPDTDS